MIIIILSVEVILAKQKKITVFSKGTILSLVYQFVCVLFPFFDYLIFCFWLGSGGCEITGTTQLLLSQISHDHLSTLLKKKKKKRKYLYFFVA